MSFKFREVNSFFELKQEICRFILYNNKQNENGFIVGNSFSSLDTEGISFGCDRTFSLQLTKSGGTVNITFKNIEDAFTIETDLEHAFLFVKGLLENSRF